MNPRTIKKSLVLALAVVLLAGPVISWTTADARPPRGNPTSPPHVRAAKGLGNLLRLRTPSHRRPQAPNAAAQAAVGNPQGGRPRAPRTTSQGRLVRSSRSGLHRTTSRSGSHRNLSRRSTRGLHRGQSRRTVNTYGQIPQNATQPTTYDRVPSGFDVQAARRRAALERPLPAPPGSTTTTTTTTTANPGRVPWGGAGATVTDPNRPPWGGAGTGGTPANLPRPGSGQQ